VAFGDCRVADVSLLIDPIFVFDAVRHFDALVRSRRFIRLRCR
jgi:hypothetical protein